MEQTEKFRGLSRDQIEPLVTADPKMMKEIVPMGMWDVLTIAALVIIVWLCAAIYFYIIKPGTDRGDIFFCIFHPDAIPYSTAASSNMFFGTIFVLFILAFIGALAYKRRNLKGRLDMGYFASELEIKYDASRLIGIKIKLTEVSSQSWADVPGFFGSTQIRSLRFVDYASGHSALFVLMRKCGARSHPSEHPHMVLEKSEKERLVAALNSFPIVSKSDKFSVGTTFYLP